MDNVTLLLRAQNIIYRRFPEAVSDQKYPAFEHLLSVLRIPSQPSTTTSPTPRLGLESGLGLGSGLGSGLDCVSHLVLLTERCYSNPHPNCTYP
jgi:hypothetical protein